MSFSVVVTWMLIGLVMAGLLTGWARRYALSSELLDHPNDRSSHTTPTPRGGGIAIVASCLLLAIALASLGLIEPQIGRAHV